MMTVIVSARNLLRGKLNGAQEFTALYHLYKASKSEEYDIIILDTAPLQNSKIFLESAQKISDLFDKKLMRWFSGEKKLNIFTKVVYSGVDIAVNALSKVTGKEFFDELRNFFKVASDVSPKIQYYCDQIKSLLAADTTTYILTSGGEAEQVEACKREMSSLSKMGAHCRAIIFNRVKPPQSLSGAGNNLSKSEQKYLDLFKVRLNRVAAFKKSLSTDVKIATISERESSSIDKPMLLEISDELKGLKL